ncbi:MAG: tetratricopeptide repeat protein [bacterium]
MSNLAIRWLCSMAVMMAIGGLPARGQQLLVQNRASEALLLAQAEPADPTQAERERKKEFDKRIERGQEAYEAGDFARARNLFDSALKYAANPAQAEKYITETAARMKEREALLNKLPADPKEQNKAIAEIYDSAVKAYKASDMNAAREGFRQVWLVSGDYKRTLKYMKEVDAKTQIEVPATSTPQPAVKETSIADKTLLDEGRKALKAEDFGKARAAVNQYLKAYPGDAEGKKLLENIEKAETENRNARLKEDEARATQAAADKTAVEKTALVEQVARRLSDADNLYGQGRLDAAMAGYESVLKLDPANADAREGLGKVARDNEKARKAEAVAKQQAESNQKQAAEKDKADRVEKLIAEARSYSKKEDYPTAIAAYQSALAIDPTNSMANKELAKAQEALKAKQDKEQAQARQQADQARRQEKTQDQSRLQAEVKRAEDQKKAEKEKAALEAEQKKIADEQAKKAADLAQKQETDKQARIAEEKKKADEQAKKAADLAQKQEADKQALEAEQKKMAEEQAKKAANLAQQQEADKQARIAEEKKKADELAKKQEEEQKRIAAAEQQKLAQEKKLKEEQAQKEEETRKQEQAAQEEQQRKDMEKKNREVQDLVADGEKLLAREKYDDAIAKADQALEILPGAVEAESLKSKALQAKQEVAAREQQAQAEQQAKDASAQRVAQLFGEAQDLYNNEQYDAAIAKLEEALTQDPKHKASNKLIEKAKKAKSAQVEDQVDSLIAEGKRQLKDENYSEAAAKFQEALVLDPSDTNASGVPRKSESETQRAGQRESEFVAGPGRRGFKRRAQDGRGRLRKREDRRSRQELAGSPDPQPRQ